MKAHPFRGNCIVLLNYSITLRSTLISATRNSQSLRRSVMYSNQIAFLHHNCTSRALDTGARASGSGASKRGQLSCSTSSTFSFVRDSPREPFSSVHHLGAPSISSFTCGFLRHTFSCQCVICGGDLSAPDSFNLTSATHACRGSIAAPPALSAKGPFAPTQPATSCACG